MHPPVDAGVPQLVSFVVEYCYCLLGEKYRPTYAWLGAYHSSQLGQMKLILNTDYISVQGESQAIVARLNEQLQNHGYCIPFFQDSKVPSGICVDYFLLIYCSFVFLGDDKLCGIYL